MSPPPLATSSTTAPNAAMVRRFSSLKASENTMWSGKPRAAHTNANEMPVVPAVYSTTVSPGWSRPSRSAPSIAVRAIRSFMLPVGFANSSLTSTRAEPVGITRTSSTSGVVVRPAAARCDGPSPRTNQRTSHQGTDDAPPHAATSRLNQPRPGQRPTPPATGTNRTEKVSHQLSPTQFFTTR